MTNDYSKYCKDVPDSAALSKLAAMIQQLYDAELEVLKLEANLKKAKKHNEFIAEKMIPDHMKTIGIKQITVEGSAGDITIKVEEKISAKPNNDNKPRVFKWLIDNGHGHIIKRTLSMLFGVKEGKQAAQIKELLMKKKLAVKEDLKVESQTLSALVRKLMEAGEDIPMKMFGVYDKRVAKITEGKPKDVFDGENL